MNLNVPLSISFLYFHKKLFRSKKILSNPFGDGLKYIL